MIMLGNVARKSVRELELLLLVSTVSLGVSSAMIGDGAHGMRQVGLMLGLSLAELVVGVAWLIVSARIIHETGKLMKKHCSLFFLKKTFPVEERKRETDGLIRDVMALYRGYYNYVRPALVLAIAVGLFMVATSVYTFYNGTIEMGELVFRFMIPIPALLAPSVLYIYVHKSWGEKLLGVKEVEKKLAEILGEID